MVNILQNTERFLKEQREEFIKGSEGKLRILLESIWSEYIMYKNKEVTFPLDTNIYEEEFIKRGFECKVGSKWGQATFVVSWK